MNTVPSSPNPLCRTGITLLEVLVACGILVIGLASVAALLPAATSVLADATRIERAANLATNAVADLRFQGIPSATRFQGPVKTLVIGSMFPDIPFGQNPFVKQVVSPTPLDEQAYGGAIITPLSQGVEIKKGMPAKATVVVFRQEDADVTAIRLRAYPSNQPASNPAAGIFTIEDTAPTVAQLRPSVPSPSEAERRRFEAARKRFLPGCAWAAVIVDNAVLWLHVGNSWATYTKAGQTRADKKVEQCFVSFSDPDAAADAADENSALTVYAFAGVLKLEEHIVTLE